MKMIERWRREFGKLHDLFGTRGWNTIFPQMGGDGSSGNASDEEGWEAADEASLAHLPLPSCYAARFLAGCGLVPASGPGVGDLCSEWSVVGLGYLLGYLSPLPFPLLSSSFPSFSL